MRLPQRSLFYLSDPLLGDAELLSDFLQCLSRILAYAES